MKTIDLEDVVMDVVNTDPSFLKNPEPVRQLIENYIRLLPHMLQKQDLLDKLATTFNIMKARDAFWFHCSRDGYATKVVDVYPVELFALRVKAPAVISLAQGQLANRIEWKIIDATTNAVKFIQNPFMQSASQQEMSPQEEQILLGSSFEMSPENLELLKSGKLLMRDLIVSQPMVIFGPRAFAIRE